jgi:DNA-binding transcriptional ArsR family regulator
MPLKRPGALSVRQAAQLFKLLGDERRLQALLLLEERGEMHVNELCAELGCTQPLMSHWLALLRRGGLVACRRDGRHNFYTVASEAAQFALNLVRA